jgi:proteic killer suppression protein
MIMDFRDKITEAIWSGRSPKGFPNDLVRRAQIKLALLNTATTLNDLRVPPANGLEALKGDRIGQHSIRINDQWRICFVWRDGNAIDVEIVDYH